MLWCLRLCTMHKPDLLEPVNISFSNPRMLRGELPSLAAYNSAESP